MQSIKRKTAAPKGFILYRGPSVLDGKPIVCIAILKSSNIKTGNMIQTFILREDMLPTEAVKLGFDSSVCGSCQHRHYNEGPCYVNVGQAPNGVYRAFERGNYPMFNPTLHMPYLHGRALRLGSYGDPAAVPFDVWIDLVLAVRYHTGYTHQMMHENFDKRIMDICMVSADSPKQAMKYQAMGAHTFRVTMHGDNLLPNEVECLSDSQGITCLECKKCDGLSGSVAIQVHGSRQKRFHTHLIPTLAL